MRQHHAFVDILRVKPFVLNEKYDDKTIGTRQNKAARQEQNMAGDVSSKGKGAPVKGVHGAECCTLNPGSSASGPSRTLLEICRLSSGESDLTSHRRTREQGGHNNAAKVGRVAPADILRVFTLVLEMRQQAVHYLF